MSFTWSQNCCEEAEIAIDNCGGIGCYIPQCTENCNWEPMQCWESTGYCWCVDGNGVEIEGTSTPSWQGFPDCSATLLVPSEYPSIQSAIEASSDGDTIIISAGIYYESMINSGGKNIIISGEVDLVGSPLVTIDGQGEGIIFMFNGADGPGCTIENLIIQNSSGNAVWMYSSNPVIRNCTFSNNVGESVSAIWGSDSILTIEDCIFTSNSTDIIMQNYSTLWIMDCVFENSSISDASLIINQSSSAFILGSEFNGNNTEGGQIIFYGYNDGGSSVIENCSFDNYINPILDITRTNLEVANTVFQNNNTDGPIIVVNEEEPVLVFFMFTNFCGNGSDDPNVLIEGPWVNQLDNSFSLECSANCDTGYIEINDLCFHQGDISVLQKMIDNSYESNIDLGCEDYPSSSCGSPNPYMDSLDSWFWVTVDNTTYEWPGNNNGMVEPLELGLQEWESGRLTSLMCGAYIYCSLSGPIPEEIGQLTEIETLRLEYNYLSGFIPENICELDTDHIDYLEFDVTGNLLCPPYPECIDTSNFWSQNTLSCSEIGDINYDSLIDILDIILLVSFILDNHSLDYQTLIISDINLDGSLDVLDIVEVVNVILNN